MPDVVDAGSSSPTSSGPSTPSGPSSALAALESAASAAANPNPSPGGGTAGQPGGGQGQTSTTAATTPQSPGPGQPPAQVGTDGPIPLDRHRRAIANARREAAEEAGKQYAWANGLDAAEVQKALAIWKRLGDTNSARALHQELGTELEGLNGKEPDADFTNGDGTKFFSADSVKRLMSVQLNALKRELTGQMQPILTAHEQAEQNRVTEEGRQHTRQIVGEALEHFRTIPMFTENEAAISTEMGKFSKETVQSIGHVGAMAVAYANFMAAHIPALLAKTREEAIAGFRREAGASFGSPVPGSGNQTTSVRAPKNEGELARRMEQMFQEQSV